LYRLWLEKKGAAEASAGKTPASTSPTFHFPAQRAEQRTRAPSNATPDLALRALKIAA
jgi:hypothetical protein